MTVAIDSMTSRLCRIDEIAKLLAAVITADGLIDQFKLAVARRLSAAFGVSGAVLDAAISSARESHERSSFTNAFRAVMAYEDRANLAALFTEVASAGSMGLPTRELLNTVRSVLASRTAILAESFKWDENQRRVIQAGREERILVSAGPGMGKTAVACARVTYLIDDEDVADSNIWLVSFTRAATTEIRNRINESAADSRKVLAVKISTLDSQAWKIRYGFSADEADRLFGGFDVGIDAAISLLDQRAADLGDAFGDLEHVIIDEAQDVTGARATFLLKLIKMIPASCGLTIFHDPAQAIYDYTEHHSDQIRFTEELGHVLGAKLKQCSLDHIYRTKEPALLSLYTDLRQDILRNRVSTSAEFKSRAATVRLAATSNSEGGFDQAALNGQDDALVLFRKKIEVAQASALMADIGMAHRLRMSGLQKSMQPWLALALRDVDSRYLEKAPFFDTLERVQGTVAQKYLRTSANDWSKSEAWEQLRRYASASGDRVDLFALRKRLVASPPDEFMTTECGHSGPILGTIHASKGREADDVFLQINKNWGVREDNANDYAEESRVLFVGATRARKSLSIQGGFAMPWASSTESGRCFRSVTKWKNSFQVQVGLSGDYDAFSASGCCLTAAELAQHQLPSRCSAQLEPGTWRYLLTHASGTALGSFTQSLNRDFFEIAKRHPKRGRRPPKEIRNLYIIGFSTVVAAFGDERLREISGPSAVSGFWLSPVIVGLPLAFLAW